LATWKGKVAFPTPPYPSLWAGEGRGKNPKATPLYNGILSPPPLPSPSGVKGTGIGRRRVRGKLPSPPHPGRGGQLGG